MKAATSRICFALRASLNDGIGPPPTCTWCTTRANGGFNWSRFGPTVPDDPAAFSVWQPPHPALAKTALPAAGSPWPPEGAGAAAVVVGGGAAVGVGDSERGSGFSRPNTTTAESIAKAVRTTLE